MRLFVDQLTNVDFSYLCPSRGLLGETWLANIELEGELDEQGMVCDFGTVKKACREWLDEYLDHRLLVPVYAKSAVVSEQKQQTKVVFPCELGDITCETPPSALTMIPTDTITPESVAIWAEQQLANTFGKGVKRVHIRFSVEDIQGPYYQYSHGLKKHGGNCQRIAHGHRSRLIIWQEEELAMNLIEQWANRWRDIYIGTKADLIHSTDSHHHFSYHADQGEFSLTIPKQCCYLVDSDTTVENLAQHIAITLAEECKSKICVKAFEGIGKGAIAKSDII